MYRLLLVSDKADVRSLYEQFPEWEQLGFERPTIAADAQQGIDRLGQGRYDAVSWLLSVTEGKRFFAYLSKRPEMFGMETARSEDRLRREIGAARRALSSRDAARQTKQIDDLTRMMRGEFLCDLLRGATYDDAKIDERMRSLKMFSIDPARPITTSSCRLPQGDYFLAEVWRYGRERLENALKNIFETANDEVFYVLLVINPHHMRLLGLPMREMSGDEIYERVSRHLDRCQQLLQDYFELTLDIKRVVRYDSLYALSRENAVRTAH